MKTEKAIEYFELHKKLLADINLDGLEAHEMAIEALKESQWIRVEDELPKLPERSHVSVECIVAIETYGERTTFARYERTMIRGKRVERWIWNDRICPWKVTHWKPLPKAPEV